MIVTFNAGGMTAKPELPIDLVYGGRVQLSLEPKLFDGCPHPVLKQNLPFWRVYLVQSLATSDRTLAEHVSKVSLVRDNRIELQLDLSSPELFRLMAGRPPVPCTLCVYAKQAEDQPSIFTMHMPVTVQSDCQSRRPPEVPTALLRELQLGVAEARALMQQIAEARVELAETLEQAQSTVNIGAAAASAAVLGQLKHHRLVAEDAAATAVAASDRIEDILDNAEVPGISVERVDNGVSIKANTKDETTTAIVHDGPQGPKGDKGEPGDAFTAQIDQQGFLILEY